MINIKKMLIGTGVAALMMGATMVPAFADSVSVNFENPPYTIANINGQDGWMKTGSYDVAVVANTFGFTSFGGQSLRTSDSVTSGSFGDQTFAKPLTDAVGEADSTNGSFSPGTLQRHFEMQFDLASALPTLQAGMHVSVSPDRGDGSRMSYLRFEDHADGIHVFFDDVTDPGPVGTVAAFNELDIATIDRNPHTIKLTLDTLDGPSNDVVKVWIDGVLKKTGTSWENYYRYDPESVAEQSPRIVKTVLFRESGDAHSGNAGNGFLIDNLSLSSGLIATFPTNKDQCKKDGWKNLVGSYGKPFKNQGECVSFVQSNEHAGKRLGVFTATDSLYYNGPTNSAPLYGTGAISFTWDATGNVTGGYYNEVVPPTTGTTYFNVITGGTVIGNNVNLTFNRTTPNVYGPFTFTGTLVGNVLTGTLDGPYYFTATGL